MAIPQPPPTPTLVSRSPTEHPTYSIIVNGKSLTFGGEPGDHYFENLPAFQGDNEQLVRILPRIPDGAIYLDIGANIGLTALTMAASLPRGQIYAFEPSLKSFPTFGTTSEPISWTM